MNNEIIPLKLLCFCLSFNSEPTKNQKLSNKEKNEQYSLWMDMLYRLSLCNHVSSQASSIKATCQRLSVLNRCMQLYLQGKEIKDLCT